MLEEGPQTSLISMEIVHIVIQLCVYEQRN